MGSIVLISMDVLASWFWGKQWFYNIHQWLARSDASQIKFGFAVTLFPQLAFLGLEELVELELFDQMFIGPFIF